MLREANPSASCGYAEWAGSQRTTLAVAGVSTLVCHTETRAWPAHTSWPRAGQPLESRPSCRRFQQPQAVPARWAVILADALLVSACRSAAASSRRWTTRRPADAVASPRRETRAAGADPRRLAWRCARPGRPAERRPAEAARIGAPALASRAAARAARRTTLWSASPRRPVVARQSITSIFPRVVARTGAFFNEHRRHLAIFRRAE